MINLTKEDKHRIKSGDPQFLKKVLEDLLEKEKDILVWSAQSEFHTERSRGKCQTLADIIKLLP